MANVKLFDQTGKEVSTVELNDAIFGIEPNESVVFDVVISQRASLRQGTHAVKNRSAVSGGGRKPWRQKGTGRARQGSIRSPQWRGGGVVFGPTPRSYGYKLPQKVRRLALKSVYSAKVAEDKFVAVEALSFAAPKTAEFANVLSALSIDSKVLVIVEEGNKFAELSARNLANVTVATPATASVLDINRGGSCIMNLYDVIKKPVITEKSMIALEAGKYTFEVDTRAHKLLIKQAVEAAFEGVKVASVNTVTVKPKQKRVGRYTGFTSKTKKAIITLTADSKAIELFAAEAE